MSARIPRRGWYPIRRLTNGNIEVLAGPYASKHKCWWASNDDFYTPYGWSIEFWGAETYNSLIPRLVFPNAKEAAHANQPEAI